MVMPKIILILPNRYVAENPKKYVLQDQLAGYGKEEISRNKICCKAKDAEVNQLVGEF